MRNDILQLKEIIRDVIREELEILRHELKISVPQQLDNSMVVYSGANAPSLDKTPATFAEQLEAAQRRLQADASMAARRALKEAKRATK